MNKQAALPHILAGAELSLPDLVAAVQMDATLPPDKKQTLLDFIHMPNFLSYLKGGVFGAGVAYAVAKFLGMSKRTQLLLTIAGFGIGKLLLDTHDQVFKYNPSYKSYQV